MNLYSIANQYQEILEQTFDQETGEINESAIASLEIMKSNIEDKGIAIASFIKNIDADRKAIEEAKKSMAEREAKLNNRVDYLTKYLQANMERCGINEIKSPYFVIKLKKCPISTEIIDEKLITNNYKKKKEIISIDKIKIKEELLAGVVIPGASLRQNNRLEIR